jgi:hypothetical protein
MGVTYSRLITSFHEKFVERVILSQPTCIGKKDMSSASVHPQITSKLDLLSKISKYAAKCVKNFGLFTMEKEIDTLLNPKNKDGLGKLIQKVF